MMASNSFTPCESYEPRPIRFLGLRALRDWRLKVYSVVYGAAPLDAGHFEKALAQFSATLPSPAAAAGRPGVGFVIFHQGRTGRYMVMCWWDHENELPIRVFVSPPGSSMWRPATDGESVCVWDLQVIGAERDAYVREVLTAGGAGLAGYLAAGFQAG